jgi:hypothetical protein
MAIALSSARANALRNGAVNHIIMPNRIMADHCPTNY